MQLGQKIVEISLVFQAVFIFKARDYIKCDNASKRLELSSKWFTKQNPKQRNKKDANLLRWKTILGHVHNIIKTNWCNMRISSALAAFENKHVG